MTSLAAHLAPAPSAPLTTPRLHRVSIPLAQFLDPRDTRGGYAIAQALAARRLWIHSRLLAWVLLPDGWKGLVETGPLDSIEFRVDRLRHAGERAWLARGRALPLWASGAVFGPLPSDTDPREFARTLVSTPVRAGLVDRLGDYALWDAVWLSCPASPGSSDTAT